MGEVRNNGEKKGGRSKPSLEAGLIILHASSRCAHTTPSPRPRCY